ncbi:MAG: DUF3800 domain-containing protein [Candidatus Thermoplasmatota archaeon]|nr:DUF3800 domain-containing protein [Candidatus Thermoplasmatota archaeon]
MYVLYLDESGDYSNWNENNNFVLAGVAIHEGQIGTLSRALDQIQDKFFPGIEATIPFHAVDIAKGKKKFRELGVKRQGELLGELYRMVGNQMFPNLIAFGTCFHISAYKAGTRVLDVVFEDIVTRFNTFMVRQYNHRRPTKGLIIMDQAHEKKYRELFQGFRESGTRYGAVNNVVDIPYFAGGVDTRMIQVADLVAYSVYQYYEHDNSEYFNQVSDRFDRRGPRDPPDGLKHITSEDCQCIACRWRSDRGVSR